MQENEDKTSEIGLTKGVRILRRVVIVMGFMLVIGFIVLVVAICYKFSHKPAEQMNYVAERQAEQYPAPPQAVQLPNPAEISPSLETPANKCIFKQSTDLAIEGEIVNYSLKDNILTLITSKKPDPTAKEPEHSFLSLSNNHKPTSYPQQIVIFDLCRGDILSRVNLVEEK